MFAIRILAAFVAGALLYQSTVVIVGGVLAAVAVPRAYFDWFGRPNLELALAVLDLIGFALPIGLLVAGGTLATQRFLSRSPKAILSAVLAGLVACFTYWVAMGVLVLPTDLPGKPYPPEVLLKQILVPPWWSAPGFLAPWLGFAFAAWLVLRRRGA